jgi:hypothetical protein
MAFLPVLPGISLTGALVLSAPAAILPVFIHETILILREVTDQLGQLTTKKNLCIAEVFLFYHGSYPSKSSTCQLVAKSQDHLMSDQELPFIDRAAGIRDTVYV